MPIRSNVEEFHADLRAFAKATNLAIDAVARVIVLELLRMIMVRTPVDTGRAVGSWMVRGGQADDWVLPESAGMSKEEALAAAVERVDAVDFGGHDVFWIYNNLRYIHVLEYGLYPNPPKKGSYVKGEGYVIKSEGGYSKQAPAGMVRISRAELEVKVEFIIRRAARGAQ